MLFVLCDLTVSSMITFSDRSILFDLVEAVPTGFSVIQPTIAPICENSLNIHCETMLRYLARLRRGQGLQARNLRIASLASRNLKSLRFRSNDG
jgi:hypothetical protein